MPSHRAPVVHRDIKPANIMILGAELHGAQTQIKMLDFGLALGLDEGFISLYRAAAGKRTTHDTPAVRRTNRGQKVARAVGAMKSSASLPLHDLAADESHHAESGSSKHRRAPPLERDPSRFSFAAEPAGSRMYAAPEIQDHHRYTKAEGATGGVVVTTTVVVDAYSVGAVLRHALTGVPPDNVVRDFISQQRSSPIMGLVRIVQACAGKPVVHYRYLSELPDGVSDLLNQLMNPSPRERMTISALCEHPWIRAAPGAEKLGLSPLPVLKHV
mmetsp:Transcript_15059/g.39108  ORF Transcript_15059/g.39108 Transcript_15059/m.39108 type:complete len:272 (+) Transcript_15059:678-1493(+)